MKKINMAELRTDRIDDYDLSKENHLIWQSKETEAEWARREEQTRLEIEREEEAQRKYEEEGTIDLDFPFDGGKEAFILTVYLKNKENTSEKEMLM